MKENQQGPSNYGGKEIKTGVVQTVTLRSGFYRKAFCINNDGLNNAIGLFDPSEMTEEQIKKAQNNKEELQFQTGKIYLWFKDPAGSSYNVVSRSSDYKTNESGKIVEGGEIIMFLNKEKFEKHFQIIN